MLRLKSALLFVAPVALLALSGCAESFNAQVNRFQQMPVPQGQSFVIKAADPKMAGSLEFAQYAGLVSHKLAAVGYQPAGSGAAANLIVELDYGVDQGKERQRYVAGSGIGYDPFGYGGWGRWNAGFSPFYGRRHHGYMYGFYDPFMFGSDYDQVENYTVYTSGLDMTITRASGERVFEGKAKALSTDDNLTRLVPNLVEAMFTGFPGNSGETVKITVAPPTKNRAQ
jgi:Domain of unknown function (DUF4136)